MKVRAIKEGFYDGSRRRIGDVFEIVGKKLGKWMVPADTAVAMTDEVTDEPPAASDQPTGNAEVI